MRRSALLADVLISMGPADAGGFRWALATMPSMLEVGLLGAFLWREGVADPLRRGAAGCCATSWVSRSWSRPKEAGIEGTSRPFKGGQCPASPDWRRHFKTPYDIGWCLAPPEGWRHFETPTTPGSPSHRRTWRHFEISATVGSASHRLKGCGTSRPLQQQAIPRTAPEGND